MLHGSPARGVAPRLRRLAASELHEDRARGQWETGRVAVGAGAVALAHALTENATLSKLIVSDNYIGALGAGALATALGRNSGITDIRLKGCELGDSVLQRLCDALAVRLPLPPLRLTAVL